MWVSRKEFRCLKASFAAVWENLEDKRQDIEQIRKDAFNARNDVDTLTKQLQCKCDDYKVESRPLYITQSKLVGKHLFTSDRTVEERYFKICKDCGFVTQYDTEEDALADKQALLARQIDALKEQKKSLKKK